MVGLIGIIALLIVLGLSLLITRLATVALQLTGLSKDAARFQARSAFTGTGFTTSEAEQVVRHPARRRIIMLLMTLRSAGLVSIIISLILSFGTESESRLFRLALLLSGVIVLGITRTNGDYLGAPRAETTVYPGDHLILYGRSRSLRELDRRRADASGQDAHEEFIRSRQLGPDALDISQESFISRFQDRRGTLRSTLTNQSVIAGIGNIYADEILFQAKQHPKTKLTDLTRADLQKLYRVSQQLLKAAA